jgi:branched-chain amino acid aminotransferase
MNLGRMIWMNGSLVASGEATVHVASHGLHYGSGVFEGMRAYPTARGPVVFRMRDHLERLHRSARLLRMTIPYDVDELCAATEDVIASNGFTDCYVRPIAFYGYGELRVASRANPTDVAILTWPMGTYFDEATLAEGIKAKISSWRRVDANTIPHAAKATGVYLNSMLAGYEAADAGFDEAILLTESGFVADGAGETLFLVRDGTLFTPDLSASILPGITRDTVIHIARDLGVPLVEKPLIRTDMYVANEVFLVGTAAEITPVRDVDGYDIGPPGDLTRKIQRAYLDVVHERRVLREEWVERTP